MKIPKERLAGTSGRAPALEALNLDSDGAVLFVNRSAKRSWTTQGLRQERGLRATDPAAQRELRRLLSDEQ